MDKVRTHTLNRRVVLKSALAGPGIAGVTLAGCDADDGAARKTDGSQIRPLANDYVAAPPQPRTFSPPPELDRTGEGYLKLPSANGAQLYYGDTGGDGESIVMVHAATGSAYVWGYQQRAFADAGHARARRRLSRRYRPTGVPTN